MITDVTMNNSPVRTVIAKVEQYKSSTLANTYNYNDAIKSITVERVGEESKFFGFGICQKLNVKFIDKNRAISFSTADDLKIYFGNSQASYINPYPLFRVSNNNRDENTNELSVTAYDALYKAKDHTVAELNLTSYTVREFAAACAALLGLSGIATEGIADTETCFDTYYSEGANFDGAETLRAALNAVAEATQTIYYINNENYLIFKRLGASAAALTIGKADYITLESGASRRLGTITSATELGENLSVSTAASGSTQIVRDNPFWELREDITTLLNNAIAAVGGLTINQFECDWRGNYLLEVGDKIDLVTKDNETVSSFALDDVVEYDGAFKEKTQWKYISSDDETESTPITVGESIKQTYAKVDKVNKQIDIIVSDVSANKEEISAIKLTTNGITSTVSGLENQIISGLNGVDTELETLKTEINQTKEDVTILIESGTSVSEVTTTTGYKFDKDGLTISESGKEIKTNIDAEGMTIKRQTQSGDVVLLTVNDTDDGSVSAANLHATTYLIVGANSRFEDYNESRTGCFWIR